MKRKFKLLITFLAIFAMILSCRKTEMPEGADGRTDSEVVKIGLSCELLDFETDETRSIHNVSTQKKISNANYYLFEGGLLVGQGYFDDAGDFAVSLPSRNGKYNLYVLANIGKNTLRSDILEGQMADAVHYDYGSYENYVNTIEIYGFPMSLVVSDFSVSYEGDLKLRRLAHILNVRVDTASLGTTEMDFKSLVIRNAARDFFPFAEKSKALHVMDVGDGIYADSDKLADLNAGRMMTLYVLENMRGDLFSGNKDWKQKVPDNMNIPSEQDMCSYIEIVASAKTATAYYERNVYRAYMGSSAANCDVRRHAYSTLNNRFTNDMIVDEEWRIEGDDPEITETLAFIDNKNLLGEDMKELDYIYVMPGFTTVFYIYKSNPDIEYTLTGPSASDGCKISYTRYDLSPNISMFYVTTALNWDEQFNDSYGQFSVVSSDGLISKTMKAVIRNRPLSLTFSTQFANEKPILCMAVNGPPLRLMFNAKMSGNIGGSLTYYPRRNNKSVKTLSENFSYEDSGDTMCETDMIFEAGTNTPEELFYIGSKIKSLIWNETEWSVESESYYKHPHPTDITLNIDLACSWEDRTASDNYDNFIIYPTGSTAKIPLQINHLQYTRKVSYAGNTQTTTYTGGGTDFGITWTQHDKEGDAGYEIPFRTAKGHEGNVIHVTINGISDWTDNLPYVTVSR